MASSRPENHMPPPTAPLTTSLIDVAVDPRNLFSAYQPIVDLASGAIVAYEALARWRDPELTPDRVFPAAHREGRLAELDWACRMAALEGALEAGMAPGQTLFVNIEPATVAAPIPDSAVATLERATAGLSVMIELTERALLRDPGRVLRVVRWARDHGWGVALDDVGADPASLTLLPFIAPDVIKLDISLVQQRNTPDQARIMAAVLAHAERTGARLLAEGVEDSVHLEHAIALGATLGQGWHFGRPGELGADPACETPIPMIYMDDLAPTPYSLVSRSGRTRIGRKGMLLGMSNHLESLGLGTGQLVILSAFQTGRQFTPATAQRYAELSKTCALVGALGVGMPTIPVPGVRGADLGPDDDLRGEWTVIALGPHYAGALIATDLGDNGPELERRFEFAMTYERPVVVAAARSLMSRLLPDR